MSEASVPANGMRARRLHPVTPDQANLAPPLWLLYPLFFAAVYLSHITLLRLPYFWDEAGYYIPAAWDFFRTGSLIPQTTVTNAHPPLPSILLAAWWRLSGFVPSGTRTLVCMVSSAALLAIFRLSRTLLGARAAVAVTVLTAIYPVWFAQSTLAHADIFAAAFTLWALSVYFDSGAAFQSKAQLIGIGGLFSCAVLSKETAIVTPAALAVLEVVRAARSRICAERRGSLARSAALAFPLLPLLAWYAYHYHRTGFVFGNPEFLRYNATANMDTTRIALGLYHRLLHLTAHMNMFVPVVCAIAALLMPRMPVATVGLSRRSLRGVLWILIANWVAFSILGGALLTRYLLPLYPLVLLLCVAAWQIHLRASEWMWVAALSAAGFVAGIFVNPPYAFAPEDNLTYRDFVVLQQRAINYISQHYPQATVLTAWPAYAELQRPELGYVRHPIRAVILQNFSLGQIEVAAQPDNITSGPSTYDTALIFSTKWSPPAGSVNLSKRNNPADAKYFDFHEDIRPAQAAALLHGEVVWQGSIRGEWAAVLHFPRVMEASSLPLRGPGEFTPSKIAEACASTCRPASTWPLPPNHRPSIIVQVP